MNPYEKRVCGIPVAISVDVTEVQTSEGVKVRPVVLIDLAREVRDGVPSSLSQVAIVMDADKAERVEAMLAEGFRRATRAAGAYEQGLREVDEMMKGVQG